MELIDFDEKFNDYLSDWIQKNGQRYKKIGELEEKAPEIYLEYINKPMDYLDGKTPAEYFSDKDDPEELIAMLRAYEDADISVPDLLHERIVELGEDSVSPLMQIVRDAEACECLKTTSLNLLIEIGSSVPMEECLRIVDARKDEDDVADVAAELLQGLGKLPVDAMLERLDTASPSALETYTDILCNFPGDERIFKYTLKQFETCPDRRAMFASFLGKLGDERAIEPLRRVLTMIDINYLDFVEIANAIEQLGGEEVDRNRNFDGDPYYESLKQMGLEYTDME